MKYFQTVILSFTFLICNRKGFGINILPPICPVCCCWSEVVSWSCRAMLSPASCIFYGNSFPFCWMWLAMPWSHSSPDCLVLRIFNVNLCTDVLCRFSQFPKEYSETPNLPFVQCDRVSVSVTADKRWRRTWPSSHHRPACIGSGLSLSSQRFRDTVSKLCGTLCHEPLFILLFPRPRHTFAASWHFKPMHYE